MKPGALISVTDVNGIVTNYEVVEVVILPGDAKEEMKSGGYSLQGKDIVKSAMPSGSTPSSMKRWQALSVPAIFYSLHANSK